MKSLMSSAILYLVSTACFVLVGTLLWMYVQANPGDIPADVLAKADAVFPWFIVNRLPVGASGLLVAAIVAAAMSTVSSTLNSGATVLMEDYWKRFAPSRADAKSNIVFLRLATALGFLCIAWVAFGQDLTGFSARMHVNLAIVLGTVAIVASGAALSIFMKGKAR